MGTPSVGKPEAPLKLMAGIFASGPDAVVGVSPNVKLIFEYENRSSFTALVENVWFQLPVNACAGPPCCVSNGCIGTGLLKKSGVKEPSDRR